MCMAVRFNHTIIPAHDKQQSAEFFTGLFGLPSASAWGPFLSVELADGVFLQFAEPGHEFPPHHYAFLIDDGEFDRLLVEIEARDIPHWADPRESVAGINTGAGCTSAIQAGTAWRRSRGRTAPTSLDSEHGLAANRR
jgi:catechol 2,3-dioxygenase-like lactoylglutathione lyase family enzyme